MSALGTQFRSGRTALFLLFVMLAVLALEFFWIRSSIGSLLR